MNSAEKILIVLAASAAAAAAAFFLRDVSVDTSVVSLAGKSVASASGAAGAEVSSSFAAIFSSGDAAANAAAREKFRMSLPAGCSEKKSPVAPAALSGLLSAMVSSEDEESLKTAEGRAGIARRALRRYCVSVAPPLFPPEEDLFCLKENFLRHAASSTNAVLFLEADADVVSRMDSLRSLAEKAEFLARSVSEETGVEVSLAGACIHSARAAERCRQEIDVLSAVSFLCIAAVAFAVFRPRRYAFYAFASLAASVFSGAAVLFLLFPKVHIVTLVFGTSVLGMAVDYSFHALLSSRSTAASLRRGLSVSFATTALALVPLALSSVEVLRQSAAFLFAALAFSYFSAMFILPSGASGRGGQSGFFVSPRILRFAVFSSFAAMSVAAFFFKPFATSLDSVYRPPEDLVKAEALLRENWKPPSPATVENIAALYREHASRIASVLGLGSVPSAPAAAKPVSSAIEETLASMTRETSARLAVSLFLMAALLAVLFRRQVLKILFPVAFAVLAAGCAVTFFAGRINLFHLLGVFLLAGTVADYAVFLHGGSRESLKSASAAFLTSVVGFGALAFVSFPVVGAFGFVLGIGLAAGFAAAVACAPSRRPAGRRGTVEKAASPLGLEILYFSYRLFGLRTLRFLSKTVAVAVWLFSSSVRRAVSSPGKMAMFALSLADKIAVVSGGRSVPCVVFDGSDDARSFERDVASGKGVFIVPSHVGTIEVLAVLGKGRFRFHAWTDLARTAVFNAFYLRHSRKGSVVLHDISSIGLATAFEAGEWLDRGESLVMSGDRGDGVFRFAAALGCPVYFAACIYSRGGYTAVVRSLAGGAKEMKERFSEIASSLKTRFPGQDFEWSGENGV